MTAINEAPPNPLDWYDDELNGFARGIETGGYKKGSIPDLGVNYSDLDTGELERISDLATKLGFKAVIFNFDVVLTENIKAGKVHRVLDD